MANEIPSSAIKFYDAPSGGTQVTSGTAGSKTVYGRVIEPFVEGLTGVSINTGFPYYGRSALSGTKNFVCGADVEPFTLTLPAFGVIPIAEEGGASDAYVSYSGESSDWNSGDIIFAADAGRAIIGFYLNTSQVTISSNPTQFSIVSLKVNGQDVIDGSTFNISGDVGRVKRYLVEIVFDVDQNSTIVGRGIGDIDITTTEGTKTLTMTQLAGDANMSLSINNASVDNTTGLSSTAVNITANDNWTV